MPRNGLNFDETRTTLISSVLQKAVADNDLIAVKMFLSAADFYRFDREAYSLAIDLKRLEILKLFFITLKKMLLRY